MRWKRAIAKKEFSYGEIIREENNFSGGVSIGEELFQRELSGNKIFLRGFLRGRGCLPRAL